MPPVTPCPGWCREGFHAWEPDGDGYLRMHRGFAPRRGDSRRTVEFEAVDLWTADEGVIHTDPVVITGGHTFAPEDVGRVADLADALAEAVRLLDA